MIDYENLIVERERSEFPTGLKHFKKDEIYENSLFDLELTKHKVVSIVKGHEDGKEDTTGYKAESEEDAT